MGLTGRQLEFLAAIEKLYKRDGVPVHYSDVADQIGVSKWTAYDVMTQLRKLGLLNVKYITRNDNMPGRSTVAFVPVDIGTVIKKAMSDDNWELIQDNLLAKIKQARHEDTVDIINQIINEISQINTSFLFCAYTIALLIMNIDNDMEDEIREGLKEVAKMQTNVELKLSMLIGMFLGRAIKANKNSGMFKSLLEYVNKFQRHITNIPQEEQNKLLKFALNSIT